MEFLDFRKEAGVPTYIVLGQFTDQGIRNVKDSPKRAEAMRAMATRTGVTVKDVYWTLGQYDIVTVVDAPDDTAVTAMLLSKGSLGNVRTHCLRAFNVEEMGKILGKME
jgi:uncharacterized protein with GYD domain